MCNKSDLVLSTRHNNANVNKMSSLTIQFFSCGSVVQRWSQVESEVEVEDVRGHAPPHHHHLERHTLPPFLVQKANPPPPFFLVPRHPCYFLTTGRGGSVDHCSASDREVLESSPDGGRIFDTTLSSTANSVAVWRKILSTGCSDR